MNKVRRLNFKNDLKIVVVGTKSDKTKYREVSLYEGQEFAVDNKCLFVETSACIPKQNIQEIFAQLLVKNTDKHNLNITLRTKKRRKDSHDVTPPPSPTRRTFKIYDSVRNFVQKKRRQSTSDYCRQHYEKPVELSRDRSKSMIFLWINCPVTKNM